MSIHLEAPREATLGQEELTEMNCEPWNPVPAKDKEGTTGTRSVHNFGTSNQARWHERLSCMFRAGDGAVAGMQGTIPGCCGQ